MVGGSGEAPNEVLLTGVLGGAASADLASQRVDARLERRIVFVLAAVERVPRSCSKELNAAHRGSAGS